METFQAFLDACGESLSRPRIQMQIGANRPETNGLHVEKLGFESPPEDRQRGFFHSTGIPIESFVISGSQD